MGEQKKAFRASKREGAVRGEGPRPEYVPAVDDAWNEWWREWHGEMGEGVDADAPNGAADEPLTEE